jgi:hypothetical protein
LQSDSKSAVRAEAAQSLGKLRPISQEAGMALQMAASSDTALRVRLQARTSLIQYQVSGFRSKLTGPDLGPNNQEPPLAAPTETPPQSVPTKPTPGRIVPVPASTSAAKVPLVAPPQTTVAQPAPASTMRPPLVPTDPPQLRTPPSDDGPVLNMPY